MSSTVELVLLLELRREGTKPHWGGARPPERWCLIKLYPGDVPTMLTLAGHSAVWKTQEDGRGFGGIWTAQGGQWVQREAQRTRLCVGHGESKRSVFG